MTRREFVRTAVRAAEGIAVLSIPAGALLRSHRSARVPFRSAAPAESPVRWVFLMDTTKCVGCGLCVKACKLENEVPYDVPAARSWVERYVLTKDGKVHADSPNAGRDGFTSARIDEGEGKFEEIKPEDIVKGFFVPKMCNHCDNPPCVQVCPVGATYQTADGVVLVDRKTCIGCGYCIMACPYGARFFHPVYKTAEKCTWCYHRISKGLKTACVEACPFEARQIGNIKDPDDPVTKVINTERVGVLKDEYGCKPQVYYIGLSKEVR